MQTSRIALIGLPGLLTDILAASLVNESDLDVRTYDEGLETLDAQTRASCDLFITSADSASLVAVAGRELLLANPTALIINVSASGRSGELIALEVMCRPLGEVFPEKILSVARNPSRFT